MMAVYIPLASGAADPRATHSPVLLPVLLGARELTLAGLGLVFVTRGVAMGPLRIFFQSESYRIQPRRLPPVPTQPHCPPLPKPVLQAYYSERLVVPHPSRDSAGHRLHRLRHR